MFSNSSSLVANQAALSLFETIGFGADFRSMEGIETPNGATRMDLTTNLAISTFPHNFTQTLITAGYSDPAIKFIPSGQVHLSRGMTPYFGLDLGWLKFGSFSLVGGSAKIKIFSPDEGPGIAIRVSYQVNNLDIISTKTITPQLIIGRKLEYAETYLGIAVQYMSGHLEFTQSTSLGDIVLTADGSGKNWYVFTGTLVEVPLIGLLIGMEGSYSYGGTSTLQTKIGFRM
jgi:hypothetical protein